MRPADAGDEHDRERHDPEHQRGAEVGLHEDERGRRQAQQQISGRALARRAAPGAVDDKAGECKHEQQLAQLRRLKAEEGKVEGAP